MNNVLYKNQKSFGIIKASGKTCDEIYKKMDKTFLKQIEGLSIGEQMDFYFLDEDYSGKPFVNINEFNCESNLIKTCSELIIDEKRNILIGCICNERTAFITESISFESSDNNGAGYEESSWTLGLVGLIGNINYTKEDEPLTLIINSKTNKITEDLIKGKIITFIEIYDDADPDFSFIDYCYYEYVEEIKYYGTLNGFLNLNNRANYPQRKPVYLYLDNNEETLEIVIDENIKEIKEYAFSSCVNLKKVIFNGSYTEIGIYAFLECKGLEEVVLPSNIKKIPEGLFYDCSCLSKVDIPVKTKEIGAYAFCSCKGLKEIKLENVTSIGESGFSYCLGLFKIILGNKLEIIKHNAFNECSSLKQLVFPKSLKTVENYAFRLCCSLEVVIINKEIESIGKYVFSSANIYLLFLGTKNEFKNINYEGSSLDVFFYNPVSKLGYGQWKYENEDKTEISINSHDDIKIISIDK